MSQAPIHMDLLRGWIGPRVHQALTAALDWKTQGSPATKDAQEVEFEDDGNSLRVRSSKKEFVQICKVCMLSGDERRPGLLLNVIPD